ncbi:hypothetical protein NX774_17465 [Massilia agilis]|uniref:Uncharacterized protein n=1 Tax=Massilia agilis TaxID=1811226 RepID=A0ABT2DEG0_9BURK|nr:DUF6544 family protein [Massilia agilis]MCS0809713.1 hypothetical protein [Massilia agilis]
MANARKGWLWAAAAGAGLGVAAWLGHQRQQRASATLRDALLGHDAAAPAPAARVRFEQLDALPGPVQRYFRRVLADGQPLILDAQLQQEGSMRASLDTERWMTFSATHLVRPAAPGFVWNARVQVAPLVHLRVLDAYAAGHGASELFAMSALRVGAATPGPELDAGALHRYLAEGVWYPSALLPGEHLAWTPIDEHRALATLTDRGTTVSLEFRFNAMGEVTSVYTPARWCTFGSGYQQRGWEGRVFDYIEQDGMRVPSRAEVGWYDDAGQWQCVWQGQVTGLRYTMQPGE